jgi:hypothetical protein
MHEMNENPDETATKDEAPSRFVGCLKAIIVLVVAMAILAVVAVILVGRTLPRSSDAWTPADVTAPTAAPVIEAEPTVEIVIPTAEPPRETPVSGDTVTFTEDDLEEAVRRGIAAQGELLVEGVGVRFTGGRMRLTAERLEYGMVRLRNLDLIGRLVAVDGQLQLQAESVQPSGLAGAMIPGLANQALASLNEQWYVEEVITGEGQVTLRLR